MAKGLLTFRHPRFVSPNTSGRTGEVGWLAPAQPGRDAMRSARARLDLALLAIVVVALASCGGPPVSLTSRPSHSSGRVRHRSDQPRVLHISHGEPPAASRWVVASPTPGVCLDSRSEPAVRQVPTGRTLAGQAQSKLTAKGPLQGRPLSRQVRPVARARRLGRAHYRHGSSPGSTHVSNLCSRVLVFRAPLRGPPRVPTVVLDWPGLDALTRDEGVIVVIRPNQLRWVRCRSAAGGDAP